MVPKKYVSQSKIHPHLNQPQLPFQSPSTNTKCASSIFTFKVSLYPRGKRTLIEKLLPSTKASIKMSQSREQISSRICSRLLKKVLWPISVLSLLENKESMQVGSKDSFMTWSVTKWKAKTIPSSRRPVPRKNFTSLTQICLKTSNFCLISRKKENYMELFGKFLANSILNSYLIGINFSPVFVKMLYNDSVDFEDLLEVVPEE